MTDPVDLDPLPDAHNEPASWRFTLSAGGARSLRVGVKLRFIPRPRSVVVIVDGYVGDEPATAQTGLMWSDSLDAHYAYFPAHERAAWLSDDVRYAEPITSLAVSLLAWPSRDPLEEAQVHRIFVETSVPGHPDRRSLKFADRGLGG